MPTASATTGTTSSEALAAAAALPLPGDPGSTCDASTQTDIGMQSLIWQLIDSTVPSGQAPGTRAANPGPLQGNCEKTDSQSSRSVQRNATAAAAAAAPPDGSGAGAFMGRTADIHRQPPMNKNEISGQLSSRHKLRSTFQQQSGPGDSTGR